MPAILATVFLGCTFLSLLFTRTANVGVGDVLRDGTCVLLFLLMYAWREKHVLQRALLQCLTWISVIACAIGLFLFVSESFPRLTGPFVLAPNVFAGFLLLAWPCAWLTLRKHFLLQTGITGILLGSLFLTQSRGAILMFALQLLAILFLQKSNLKTRSAGWTLMFAVAFVTLALLVRSYSFPLPDLGTRAVFSDAAGTVPAAERIELMRQGLLASFDRPVFGWGPESFAFVGPHYQNIALANADDPHNIVLRLAAERGWIAAIAFIILCLYVLRKVRVRMQTDAANFAVFLGCAGVFLHAMMDRDLAFAGVAIPFWLLLGSVTQKAANERLLPQKILQGFIAVTLVASLFIHQSQDAYLLEVRTRIDSGQPSGALAALQLYQHENNEDARGWILCAEAKLMNGDPEGALACADAAMRFGKFAYPEIARHIVRIALAKEDPEILESRMPAINDVIVAFDEAIAENRNYAAESRVRTEIDDLKADIEYARRYLLQL